jgi:hypothetical protein
MSAEGNEIDLHSQKPSLGFTRPAKIMLDAFEAAATALEEAGLHPRCTSDLASCPICRAHLLTEGLSEEQSLDVSNLSSNEYIGHDVIWPLSEKSTHCFYELPQITENKRLSMLEHEGYMSARDETACSHLNADEDFSHILGTSLEKNMRDVSSSTKDHLAGVLGKESAYWSGLPGNSLLYTHSFLVPDRLPGTCVEESNSAELPPLPNNLTFQPWRPIDAISMTELLESLGLDETDRVLSFDLDFSYTKPSTVERPLTDMTDFSGASAPFVSDMIDDGPETPGDTIKCERW